MSIAQPRSPQIGMPIETARRRFALPEGARRLIASGGLEGRTDEPLARWLSSDHELAMRLLRWCNTPLYNLSRPYRSLFEAAQVMDGCELSRLALLAHVRGFFLPDAQVDIYERQALWRHSIAVGAVASMISRTCGSGDPSVVFVAGALHDIGLCVSERLCLDAFATMVAEIDALTPTCEIERDVMGWDHTLLGGCLLESWGMAAEVQAAARLHHDAKAAPSSPHAETIGCVVIANYLCSRSGWTSLGSHNVAAPSEETFHALGIDTNLLTVLWRQLHSVLESVAELR